MSLYLPDLDALFVHVPKCAGTWIATTLSASGLVCVPACGVGTHNLPSAYSNNARRFMFVRNPLSWYESAWRGLQSGWPQLREIAPLQKERSWSPIRYLTYLVGARDFSTFCSNIINDQPGFCSRMFEWYAGPPGSPQVDFVGRSEFARQDLQTVLEWLGWNGKLAEVPPANVGLAPSPIWDESQRLEISRREFGLRRWYDREGPFRMEE